ncbi:MAG: putative flagellar biosynthesis protein FlhG [Rubritepida sp.]|nr:putative flagellar biosynthesis protein FlhG [Rubritepida sp.]
MTRRLIAIASGKGGVGKTCLAIGLAQALAEAGRVVLLVDGDLGLANVDVQLGLDPRLDLGDVLAGRCTAAQATITHPAGFGVLPGRSGSAALAALEGAGLAQLVALLRGADADDVVLDLGAGLGAAQRRLAAVADLLLVVASEEPTSLTDAYAVLKLHRRDAPEGRAGVLVNMVAQHSQALRVHAALDAACRGFLGAGVPLLGAVRRDVKVPAAIRAQTPLLTRHPNCPAAEDLRTLAQALTAEAAGSPIRAPGGRFSPATSPGGTPPG